MEPVGWIKEIWRYPISSLGGERLASTNLNYTGIAGDRAWAIVDSNTGQPAAPERELRWRPALFLSSRLQNAIPEIGFPDHAWLPVNAPDIDERLGRHFGFDVSVRPYGTHGASATAKNRYDLSPLHLITSSSMEWLANLMGRDDIDCRRFRPNIVLNSPGVPELAEITWIGCRLQMGSAIVLASEETERCGMTLIAQPSIPENPEVLRSILRHNRRKFGIYGSIDMDGTLSIGDVVSIVRDQTEAAVVRG